MKRAVVALSFLCLVVTEKSSAVDTTNPRSVAVYAPEPQSPIGARRRDWEGSGLFLCHIRLDGSVSSVTVVQSTGHEMLDQAGISAFQRWRFQPEPLKAVKIPLK